MTNYHIHLIYSERDKLDEPVKKIASRNMFFDPDGRHLRTKREAMIDGELMPGYTMVPKGDRNNHRDVQDPKQRGQRNLGGSMGAGTDKVDGFGNRILGQQNACDKKRNQREISAVDEFGYAIT